VLEEIRKGLLCAIGAVLLTREKAEAVTRKLVEEARISKEDAQKLLDELFASGTQQWSEVEASFSKALRKGIENLDIASKKELHGLNSKVGKLEKRVAMLERGINVKKGS
jgi:polyhydroxyalkanoate synthesis regulator phasin